MLTLKVEKRAEEKPDALRKAGRLPAVFYGRKEGSTPVSVEQTDFERALKEAGESTVISLEGVGDSKEALIHEVTLHPVTSKPIHADFYVIEKGRKVEVAVPLEFVGTAPVVKEKGGILIKVLHELEIEALPKNLPHEIEVDITVLTEFDSQVTVADLKLPEGVVALVGEEEVVVAVEEPREEEEEEETETEIDMDAIEVEKHGKEEAEGGEVPAEGVGEKPETD